MEASDFATPLLHAGCSQRLCDALAAYFAAVNAPPSPSKLVGVLATFETGAVVVNNSNLPISPRAFYDSPSSPVLSTGFRAEPDYGTLVCTADGRATSRRAVILHGHSWSQAGAISKIAALTNRGSGEGDIISHLIDVAAFAAEIGLHVDHKEDLPQQSHAL